MDNKLFQNAFELDDTYSNKSYLTSDYVPDTTFEHCVGSAGQNANNRRNSITDIDELLSELSSKYGSKKSTTSTNTYREINERKPKEIFPNSGAIKKQIKIVTVSDSEESDEQDVYKKYVDINTEKSALSNSISLTDSEDETETAKIITTKKQSLKATVPKMTKEEKAANKKALQEEKIIQKELKKAEDIKAKELKKLINKASKNLKPDEYIKQVEVLICDSLSEKPLAKEIFNLFHENEIKYTKASQIYPNSISWKRNSESHTLNAGKLISKKNTEDCDVIFFILECDDFVAMIENDELIKYFKSVQEIMIGKIITIGLYGVNNYIRNSKNQKKRSFKNNVTDKKSKGTEFEMFDKNVLETNLIKLQVLLSICYRYLDTAHDVAAYVNCMTKSVAQTPFKMKKREQLEQTNEYMIGDNKDCVTVDKNGNGLSRLWQQNITAFPLARLDLAESIMATYPTLNSLMQAYERCPDDNTREKLLENLEIRRAAGPLTNFRKVGPEFSKKMFNFYNSRARNTIQILR